MRALNTGQFRHYAPRHQTYLGGTRAPNESRDRRRRRNGGGRRGRVVGRDRRHRVDRIAASHARTQRVCSAAVKAGHAACLAIKQVDPVEPNALRADAVTPNATPSGYGPSDLRSAYNLTATGSSAQTVAIVDAYDDPNAESDLATYRAQYGLPACTTANGCFKKVSQTGSTTQPARRATPAGPARSRSTSTWSRRSAPAATSCSSRPRRSTMANLGTAVNEAVKPWARSSCPTATAARRAPRSPATTAPTSTTRASRSPPAPATRTTTAGPTRRPRRTSPRSAAPA